MIGVNCIVNCNVIGITFFRYTILQLAIKTVFVSFLSKNKVINEKQLVQNLEKNKLNDTTEIARLNDELAVVEKIIDELNINFEDINNTVEDYENHPRSLHNISRKKLKILKLKLITLKLRKKHKKKNKIESRLFFEETGPWYLKVEISRHV